MNRYFFEKGLTFSIRKLSVGVASVIVGLSFFASGVAHADDQTSETPANLENTVSADKPTLDSAAKPDRAALLHQTPSVTEREVPTSSEDKISENTSEKATPETTTRNSEMTDMKLDTANSNKPLPSANTSENPSEMNLANPATPSVHTQDDEAEIGNYGPLPSKAQLDYHKEELAAFIHYGMNTYTNSEWGNGKEDPKNFNPTNLDTDQWIKTLKDAGFKRTILVVKHHDGFVLYPSRYTDHTVASSSWKDGKGDVLAEISKSATKYDMNLGVYLSPWDVNNPKYTVATEKDYNEYYLNQLKEILGNPKYGNKGKFIEVWMDGARGSGAQKVTYTFDKWFQYIKEAEGDIAIFSAQPTSIRWIGNERGTAGDPVWQKVKKANITDNVTNDYLNHGDPDGDMYSVGEADVSIRSGWFYHDNQQPKSLKELMEIYFKSVGRGTPLLLNIPPNKEGKFAEADVARLKEFRATLDQMYATDFAKGATVTASSTRKNHLYQASFLTDGNENTSWAPANDAKTGEFTVDLGQKRRFDVIELKEDIAKGQRISGFKIDVELNGRWVPYGEGSTVGYRRLIQGQPVEAQKIRVRITDAQATPILNNFSVYKVPSSIEKTDGFPLGLEYHSNTSADTAGTTWYNEAEGVRGTSMWTNQQNASATYHFQGSKAYVVATVDPHHGEMSVYVDGQKVADVQTKNASRKRSQLVYETGDLAPGEHTLKLVNKTGEPIATEGIYTLNNAGKGMFELKETSYDVQKGQPVTVTIKRVGGHNGTATVHVVTEPGTGVHGKVYKDTTADLTFADGETEKTMTVPTIDFTEQADSIFDFKVKMTSASDNALLGFASEATVRVMKADLLKQHENNYDDQAKQLEYSPGWHHETNSAGKYQNTESWASFGRMTDEQKKNTSVTAYFYGTGLEIKGFVDPGHGIYKVSLDGKVLDYKDGQGNASVLDGKKYFSGKASSRQGDQTIVRLMDLEEGWHALRLQLDPERNDLGRNIGIQVDQFITHGENSALYTKEEVIQAMQQWKTDLDSFDQSDLKDTPVARQAFKTNLETFSRQLTTSPVDVEKLLLTVTSLQEILANDDNFAKVEEIPNLKNPEKTTQPNKPTDSKIVYDKAIQDLTEAFDQKAKELTGNKVVLKKLVDLTEHALATIQEAKTQEALDKALQDVLTAIHQLQATPKAEPSEPAKPVEPAEPTKPVQPENPSEPVKPVQPENPAEPSEPAQPVKPVEPSEPAQPVEPAEPVKPVQPEKPAKPSEPAQPVEPVEPNKPVQPEKPAEPVKPVQPEKPAEPSEPAQPAKPAEPVKPVEPSEPAQPVKPVEPAKPVQPEKPVEPSEPTQPEKPAEPVKPVQPEKPVEPSEPMQPEKPAEPSEPAKPVEPAEPVKPVEKVFATSTPSEGVKDLVYHLPSLEIVHHALPFKTIRRDTTQLEKGNEQVLTQGKAGDQVEYIQVNGNERTSLLVETTSPVDEIIEVGTKEIPQHSFGTDLPPIIAHPEYPLPTETSALSNPVGTRVDTQSGDATLSPIKDSNTSSVKTTKAEKQLPNTGEETATALLWLATITAILSLLVFNRKLND